MSSFSSSDTDHLQCKLCFELFDAPRVLQCGHSMCTKCVEQAASFNAARPGSATSSTVAKSASLKMSLNTSASIGVTCGHCSQVTLLVVNGVYGLPLNRDLAAAVAEYQETLARGPKCQCGDPAAFVCHECKEDYCVPHWAEEHCTRKTRDHKQHPVGTPIPASAPTEIFCALSGHEDDACTYFCNKCGTLACNMCSAQGLHQGHDIMSLTKYVVVATTKIQQYTREAEAWLQNATRSCSTIDQTKADVKRANETFKAKLAMVHASIVGASQARCDALAVASDRLETEKVASLNAQKESIERTMTAAQQAFSITDSSGLQGKQVIQLSEQLHLSLKKLVGDGRVQPIADSDLNAQVDSVDAVGVITQMGSVIIEGQEATNKRKCMPAQPQIAPPVTQKATKKRKRMPVQPQIAPPVTQEATNKQKCMPVQPHPLWMDTVDERQLLCDDLHRSYLEKRTTKLHLYQEVMRIYGIFRGPAVLRRYGIYELEQFSLSEQNKKLLQGPQIPWKV